MAEERFVLTRAGYEALNRELQMLEQQYSETVAELTDVDNADPTREEAADEAIETTREDEEQRISHLKLVLQEAQVIDEDPDPDRANPGDRVTVWDFSERKTYQFDLLGGEEIISGRKGVAVDSPVGKALLGHCVGDVVEVEVPDGKVRYAFRTMEPIPHDLAGGVA